MFQDPKIMPYRENSNNLTQKEWFLTVEAQRMSFNRETIISDKVCECNFENTTRISIIRTAQTHSVLHYEPQQAGSLITIYVSQIGAIQVMVCG